MRKIVTLLYSVLTAALLVGCGSPELAMKKGDKFYELGEYYDAAEQYKKAYAKTPTKDRPTRGERALKMADCYRRINYTQKAIAAYNNAVRFKKADTLALLRLGQLQLKNGNYREAEKLFQALRDSGLNSPLIRNGLESARMAPEWRQKGSKYTVKRQDLFNSRRSDYSPVLGGDDYNQLYITSTRNQAQRRHLLLAEGRQGQVGQAADHRLGAELRVRRGCLRADARRQDNVSHAV